MPTPQVGDLEGRIEEISQAEARSFILDYEWLGNAGASRYCYGLKYGIHLTAVVCFARPTAPSALSSLLGADAKKYTYQLCRGASAHWAPKHAPSMLIGEALRRLEQRTGAQLVIAYADPHAGEVGVIYQATNALYLGLTDSRGPGKYVIAGKVYHPRSVHRIFGCAKHNVLVSHDPNYKRLQRTKKHRYIYVLGSKKNRKQWLDRLAPRIRPYPKRLSNPTAAAKASTIESPRDDSFGSAKPTVFGAHASGLLVDTCVPDIEADRPLSSR